MTKQIKRHVMIDIETMGTSVDAAIVSIGAEAFDRDFMPPEPTGIYSIDASPELFYVNVSLDDCLNSGRTVDEGAVYWWLQQSDAARAAIQENERHDLETAISLLHTFIRDNKGAKCKVWANSSSFDLAILRHAFQNTCVYGQYKCAWGYKDEVDMRTLRALEKDFGVPEPATWTAWKKAMCEDAHNAVKDAWNQALYVHTMMNRLQWSYKHGS